MKPIGPTFPQELLAAGITPDGISWSTAGNIYFNDEVDEETREAVMAVYSSHVANPPKTRMQELEEEIAGIDEQLKALDLETLRTRGAREESIIATPLLALFMASLTDQQKGQLESIKQQLYAGNPEYKRVVDAENTQAAALRAQRKVLTTERDAL